MLSEATTSDNGRKRRASQNTFNQQRINMASLTDKVVATLIEDIERGVLRPGDKIPTEAALMKQLSVSRSVVREAVSRLQAANVVETRHGVGTFVRSSEDRESVRLADADLSNLLDIMAIIEFRIDLEGAAAALAAGRRTEQHLKQIASTLARFEEQLQNRSTDVLQHDVEFHLQIARASGNRYFFDVLSQMGRGVSPRTRLGKAGIAELDQIERLRSVLSEHKAIYQAIVRQDPDDARAAMRMHLSNSRERLRHAHGAAA
ncbi:GntR family transcriptional regulator [Caballeronia glebae]|uniref:GntR family transcriptional regulator n=2 Tax=Caballeronia glebae TaxID=1777143 RepID=A0A158DFA2_9BURK|nr:GntR family transcriptional regulator [Caballeronia glebae]